MGALIIDPETGDKLSEPEAIKKALESCKEDKSYGISNSITAHEISATQLLDYRVIPQSQQVMIG